MASPYNPHAYWIGYKGTGRKRKAAFYYANADTSASQYGGCPVRHGWLAVPRVRWWVLRHQDELVPGITLGLYDMGDTW